MLVWVFSVCTCHCCVKLLKYVAEETHKVVSICKYKESITEEKFGETGFKTIRHNWANSLAANDKGFCFEQPGEVTCTGLGRCLKFSLNYMYFLDPFAVGSGISSNISTQSISERIKAKNISLESFFKAQGS